MVALNRAVAGTERDGPAAGLDLVDALAGTLDGYYLLHATRTDLLERVGRVDEAAEAYEAALERTSNGAEPALLRSRLSASRADGRD